MPSWQWRPTRTAPKPFSGTGPACQDLLKPHQNRMNHGLFFVATLLPHIEMPEASWVWVPLRRHTHSVFKLESWSTKHNPSQRHVSHLSEGDLTVFCLFQMLHKMRKLLIWGEGALFPGVYFRVIHPARIRSPWVIHNHWKCNERFF